MITSVSVGTAAVQVLPPASGAPYKFVAIGNNGSATAYLKLTPDETALTTSNGIQLPSGGSLVCDQDLQKELFAAGVSAVVGSGTTTIAVQAF